MHRGDFHAAYAAAITLLDQYGHDDPRVADRFPELPAWAGLDVDTQRLAVALLDPDDPVRLHISSSESAIVGQHRTCFARSVGAREMILWTD